MAKSYVARMSGESNPNFRALPPRRCEFCESVFNSYEKRRRFCSRICSALFHVSDPTKYFKRKSARKRTGRTSRKCRECGGRFLLRHRAAPTKFCSQKCRSENTRKRNSLGCCVCGALCNRRPSERGSKVYCWNCYMANRSGSANPNWRGGIRTENNKIRASDEYKSWRSEVFERDKFTCQECGQVGGTLHAHHIKAFATHVELRFVVDNGITLCKNCHNKKPRRQK